MNEERRSARRHIEETYGHLGAALTLLFFLFPIVLIMGHRYFTGSWMMLGSLSSHYTENEGAMRDVFVGGLFAIALALIVYRGYSSWEDWGWTLAALFAILTALIPTSGTEILGWQREGTFPILDRGTVSSLHMIFAILFAVTCGAILLFQAYTTPARLKDDFLDQFSDLSPSLVSLALFGFFPWRKDNLDKSERHKDEGERRNVREEMRESHKQFYLWYFRAIVIYCIITMLIAWLASSGTHVLLWLETAAMILFAPYWLFKTGEIRTLLRYERMQTEQRLNEQGGDIQQDSALQKLP